MDQRNEPIPRLALAVWLHALLSRPVVSDGDYFERLGAHVASSAPVCLSCA